MNRRSLIILAAIGAGLLAILLLARTDFTTSGSAGSLHAPGLDDRLDALESMRVVKAGNEVVATIERGEQGWVVAEKGGHPVDFERFRGSLRALSGARRVEKKTALAEFHARLGVEDLSGADAGGYQLELEYGDKHPRDRFIVGNRAGAGMVYMRTADDEQSWMVSADFDLSDQTRDWVDRAILDLGSGTVRRVVLDRGDGDVLDVAKADSLDTNFTPAGIPEGRELSYGSVANSIGSALANVQANDVRPASDVDGLPQAVLARYETFDGLVVELDVREDAPVTPEQSDSGGEQANPRYWVRFSVAAEDSNPAEIAPPPQAEAAVEDAQARAGESMEAAKQEEAPPNAEQRAVEMNARLTGWAYELPKYKSDQWFKKMDDLLKDE